MLVTLATAVVDIAQHASIARYISSFVQAIAYAALMFFHCRCSKLGIYNTGVVFGFWLLQTLVASIELRSQVLQDVRFIRKSMMYIIKAKISGVIEPGQNGLVFRLHVNLNVS